MKVLALLNFVRWKNLSMLIIIQYLFKYVLFDNFNCSGNLNDFQFMLFVIATITLAAGGNIINDIYDYKIDLINKPDRVYFKTIFSKNFSYILYSVFTLIGVTFGIYLSHTIDKTILSIIFLLTPLLLFFYSFKLKGLPLIGNLLVSFIIAFSIYNIVLFEDTSIEINKYIMGYASFSFLINLMREIIKDIEDIRGDYSLKTNTIPILIGRSRTKKLVFAIALISLYFIIIALVDFTQKNKLLLIYSIVLILAPYLYYIFKLYNATSRKNYKNLSALLKLIMLAGLLTIFII